MLTDQDVQKIITAGSQIFATKAEIEEFRDEMRADFAKLLTSVDGYAKKADTYFQELVVAKHRLDRHEKWIQKIAEKLGVALEI